MKQTNFYTKGQQGAARILLTVWLLTSCSPNVTLAAPRPEKAIVPATITSPNDLALAMASPTPPPGSILQLPPDSPYSLWGSSVASSPTIDRALQQRMSQEVVPDKRLELLRTSTQVNHVGGNLSFEARGGEKVRFACESGQWQAEVLSRVGAFSRQAVLPVVCSQGEDVASSLEVLSRYPSWQRQRQIHVLGRNVCPALGEVVYVGELGLKGGGEGEASGSRKESIEKRKLPLSDANARQVRQKSCSAESGLNRAEANYLFLWLREYYRQENFSMVKSLFPEKTPKHVASLECELQLLEQKEIETKQQDGSRLGGSAQQGQLAAQDARLRWKTGPQLTQERKDQFGDHKARLAWVKTPIGLQDLFKPRSTHPHKPVKEIQRILLTGAPGTGKTTLSKKMAYQWSVGTWGQEFYAVYVLPVRDLQQDRYNNDNDRKQETLETAIVNNCFTPPSNEDEYKRLREHIEEELKKPTTLVILDGLDEQAGTSKEILRQAQAGAHKLLMLSRPYGVETERQAADIEVEHRGFNDDQLRSYVQGAFRNATLAQSLLTYIEGSESIQKIVHIPVHLEIVCALWEDDSTGVREALGHGSLPSLYRKFTTWIWNRYAKKWSLKNVSAEPLFNKLGQIALDAFKLGKKISSDFVNDYVETEEEESMLQDAGLLQCIAERSEDTPSFYQFAHKTFQEYFAGRLLAVQFLADAGAQEKLQEFLQDHKYDARYDQTLLFLSGELSNQLVEQERSREYRCEQLSRLLEWLDSEPKEVVGLQHTLLQAGMLHEWLCMAAPEEHQAFVSTGSQVVDSLQQWLSKSIEVSYPSQGKQTVEQLMDAYWTSKVPELVPYIVGKLHQAPLVIHPSQGSGDQEAVLYLKSGERKTWRQSAQEREQFVLLLQPKLVIDSKTLHAYSHGDARQAVSFFERALAIKEQVYQETPNHPDIASTLNNLGAAWRALGDAKQAVSFYQRALAIKEQVYQETPNHPDIASTLNNLGAAWRALGDAKQAVSFFERALAMREQVYKETPNHPDIASTLNNLGNAWGDLGDAKQAVSFYQRALAMREQVYQETPNHPDIASTLNNLGAAWGALGDAKQAVSFFERALAIKEQVYKETPNHPDIASTLSNLGAAWGALGDAKQAASFFERALAIKEQVYQETPNHPDIASTLNNLGAAWSALGDAKQAVSFFERALAIKEQVYKEAPNHPQIARTLNNLGAAWSALGDAKQAVSFYQRALAIKEQVYQETPNHPDIASTLNNLGAAWRALGNAKQAVSFFERALAIKEQVYKETPNHPDIASTLNNLGTAWSALGDGRQAVSFYQRALAIKEQVYQETPNHPDIASTLNNLGAAWRALGDAKQAVSFYQRALAIYEQVYQETPNHPDIASTLNNLGAAWSALGDAKQAVSFYQRALAIKEQVYQETPNHPQIARTLNNLGAAWRALGDAKQAVSFLERALAIKEQVYQETPNHPDIASTLNNLGAAWRALGDAKQAVSFFERVLAIKEQVYQETPNHPDIASTLNNLGAAWGALGDAKQAVSFYQRALAIYEQVYKETPNHPDIASTLNNLGAAYENLGNHAQSLEYFQQALEMQQALHEGENHAEVAGALRTVGVIYHSLGNYTQALEYFKQALQMQQALHEEENHAEVAAALRDVAIAYKVSGNYTEALEYFKQALQMQQALHEGENHAEVAGALRTVGVIYHSLGNYTQALEYFKQALQMQQALHEGNHDAVAEVLNDVARVLCSIAENYYKQNDVENTIKYFEEALSGLPSNEEETKIGLCGALGCMYHVKALAARQAGDEQQAQAYLGKATTSFEQVVQASNAKKAGLYAVYGNFLLATGKTAQAHDYLHQAIESGDDASGLGYDFTVQPTVAPVLQAYISQQQKVSLRGIDYAYYLMIHHYEDFRETGIEMAQAREAYLAAYQASLDQRSGQAVQDKTAYYLLGSLYEAQGDQEAAAAAFARSQDGTVQGDTQAVA